MPMPKMVPPKEKTKNTLDIIKEVAELYGFELTECEPGEGGFYDGDKKIEFSETDFWDGLSEDYFKYYTTFMD